MNEHNTGHRITSFAGTSIPSSAIMLARVRSKKPERQYDILIVADDAQQRTKHGVYWKDRELSKKIMKAHFSGSKLFTYDGIQYSVEAVTKHARYGKEKTLWHKLNHISKEDKLYVFKQKGVFDDPEKYELVMANLYFPQKMQAIEVPVYCQTSPFRLFMNEETFIPMVRDYGLPNVCLEFTEDAKSDTGWVGSLNEYSKLKILGYSVQETDGMTSVERQSLLSRIIKNEDMTSVEVANYLEFFIHFNSGKPNMSSACGSWREDLEFVQKNFAETHRAFDQNGATNSTNKATEKKPTSANHNSPSNGNAVSTIRHRESTSVPTHNQIPTYSSEEPSPRLALIVKREQLNAEIESATGLRNIAKRRHLRREIKEIESKLKQLEA